MRKYQSDGGPGIVDVMAFLNGAITPYEDRLTFIKTQIVSGCWLPSMAIEAKEHYRLSQIQLRHFYETGKKVSLSEQDMNYLFSYLGTRVEDAITDAEALATDDGMPASTSGPILDGVRKRAAMIGTT